jgi:single-stranded DNA-binding protein
MRQIGTLSTVCTRLEHYSAGEAEDEWVSKVEWHRVAIFRPRLSEAVLTNIKKGAHVLVEGSLVSSTYDQPNGKAKKSKTAKITSWSIRADVVRKLDRNEPGPEAPATTEALDANEPPF